MSAALVFGALLGACTDTSSDPVTTGPAAVGSGAPLVDGGVGGTLGVPTGTGGSPGIPTGTGIGTGTGGTPGTGIGTGSVSDGGAGTATGATAGALPCDVQAIVSKKCGTCHSQPPAFSAPMPLTTDAQFQAAGSSDKTKKVYQLVKTRINATTASVKMPPTTSDQLTADELTTLNTWLDKQAPAGTTACTSTPATGADGGTAMGAPVDVTGLDCYKFTAHAQGNKAAKFKVGAAMDAYYAFGFNAGWTGTVYGIVFRPLIDNPRAIHHWLFYEEPNTDGDIATTIGQHSQGKLLAGWAPGGPTYDFRQYGDVGFELAPNTYTLEIHYNSSDPSAEDASGIELCVQKKKPTNVAGMSWLGYDQGAVLAATTGVCNPADTWTGVCKPTSQEPIHIMFVTPHLHQSGTHMKAIINGPSGTRTLIDKPFDFNYQITYSTPDILMPGETITTTCNFSKPQCFGQATAAEMCYLFTYSYPKGALADGADWGALAHGEGTCLGQSTADIF